MKLAEPMPRPARVDRSPKPPAGNLKGMQLKATVRFLTEGRGKPADSLSRLGVCVGAGVEPAVEEGAVSALGAPAPPAEVDEELEVEVLPPSVALQVR